MRSNQKIFGVFALSVFLLAIMVSGVSALTITASPSTLNFQSTNSAGTFTLTSSGSEIFNVTSPSFPQNITLAGTGSQSAEFYVNNMNSIRNTTSAKFNVSVSGLDISSMIYGKSYSFPLNITAKAVNGSQTNYVPVTFKYTKTFCNYGDINASTNNGLSMSAYVTNDGSGTQTNWDPLDTIQVEVTVYNNGNDNSNFNNLYLELGLVQQGTNNNVINNQNMIDWVSGDGSRVSIGNLPGGDSYTYTFKFTVDPKIMSALNSGSSSYYLMVKAYSNSNGQNDACVDYSSGSMNDEFGGSNNYALDVNVNAPSQGQAVVIDPSTLPVTSSASCGQQLTFNPEVYNIGSSGNTYSKQQVLVTMYSPLTGTTVNHTLYGGLNPGQGVQVPFSLNVPINADQKQYPVYFNVYYGYTDSNGNYFNNYRYVSSDSWSTLVNVQGSCVYATPATTSVQAQLQSGGKAGEPLVIQATIANTGNKTVNYNLNLEGYTSWATLSSITPSNITLAPGQSQSVTINMNVNKDAAAGNKQFSLDVYSNSYLIKQQPLSLSVTQSFWNSITGGAVSGTNVALWGFNILLILAIIVVLVIVLVRRKK